MIPYFKWILSMGLKVKDKDTLFLFYCKTNDISNFTIVGLFSFFSLPFIPSSRDTWEEVDSHRYETRPRESYPQDTTMDRQKPLILGSWFHQNLPNVTTLKVFILWRQNFLVAVIQSTDQRYWLHETFLSLVKKPLIDLTYFTVVSEEFWIRF